jgi:hypothetical protein
VALADEDRILAKLDLIEARGVDTLLAVTELKGQIRDIPDLKERVSQLERWRWTAMGALAASGISLSAQVFNLLGK